MEETKTFPLETILTVTTGRLLTKPTDDGDNGIGDLYDLLGWMAMDSPCTHQLTRFMDECKPILYRLFPELGVAEACLPKLDKWLEVSSTCPEEGIKMWLAELRMMFPEIRREYAVPQVPIEHVAKDPIAELREIVPDVELMVIENNKSEDWPEEL